MLTRGHCLPFVGQHVVVHMRDGGIHHGLLQSVTNDGIYLRRTMPGSIRTVAGCTSPSEIRLLQDIPEVADDVEQVWFPFFFLPFFALAALRPWGWYW